MKKFPFTHCVRKECFKGGRIVLPEEWTVRDSSSAGDLRRGGRACASAKIVCILSHLGWSIPTSVGIVWKFLKGPWNVNGKKRKKKEKLGSAPLRTLLSYLHAKISDLVFAACIQGHTTYHFIYTCFYITYLKIMT